MMMVVGVFGGFNVQSELRILGAPIAPQEEEREGAVFIERKLGFFSCFGVLGRSWRSTANPFKSITECWN